MTIVSAMLYSDYDTICRNKNEVKMYIINDIKSKVII